MAKYKFFSTPGPRVICVSSFAGRPVRGVAICSESDEFDLEKGKRLAQARVDAKIAEKRLDRATEKVLEAYHEDIAAAQRFSDMQKYAEDAGIAYRKAQDNLKEIEKELGCD